MTTPDARSPFKRPQFIAAAIVIGVIFVAGAIVLATSLFGGDSDIAAPTPGPVASSSSSPPADATDASICGLEGFEEESSLTAAPAADWELVGTVAAPTAPATAGPGKIESGIRTCYAHTAEGALYMAINFIAMGTDASLYPRLSELVASGPGREALEGASDAPSSTGARAQVAGYAISAYTAGAVTVDIALNYSNGSLVSVPLKLVWEENDWKIQTTDAGELPLPPAPLQNLGGYTPWSGA